eukprot:361557-Hanusia_phi.AAC.1
MEDLMISSTASRPIPCLRVELPPLHSGLSGTTDASHLPITGSDGYDSHGAPRATVPEWFPPGSVSGAHAF